MSGELEIWTIYDHPLDYPRGFIARLYRGASATTECVTENTVDEVRAQLPQGLYCATRHPVDHPTVVESWF